MWGSHSMLICGNADYRQSVQGGICLELLDLQLLHRAFSLAAAGLAEYP